MPPRQQDLFAAEPEAWEVDAAEQQMVASVVLTSGPDAVYDYEVPPSFCDPDRPERFVEPGRRVRVPFGRSNRAVAGYVVEASTKATGGRRLKAVAGVVDARSLLSPKMLRLTRWMADYYLCPWGQVLDAVAPAAVRRMAGTRQVQQLSVPDDVRERLDGLKLRSAVQRRALDELAKSERPLTTAELAARIGSTEAPIRALLKQGLVEAKAARVASNARGPSRLEDDGSQEPALTLNADQSAALQSITSALDSGKPTGILLHGVTGSGKTEVYLRAIEHVASFGRQAIVLVPEISLTPQTVRRFAARFERVAVLHSHLSDAERHAHWQRIASGEVQVVVGARSAIFAPAPHLGLIVLDEEHESTFKQDTAPRYHARDVAWQRAQAEGVPLVLGSATPSLESWQRALDGVYQLASLPQRVMNLPLPQVMTVDLRDPAHTRRSRGAISRPLHQAMTAALRDDGQVMLLLNRRGFATHIQCPACGFALKCEHCELPLTFHRQGGVALCHYCDFQAPPPRECPDCKSPAIRYGGLGTQKLEDEVRSRFPDFTCARMDADSMRGQGSHDRVLSAFRRGEVRILLGTQMIAKGLDFPNVTLVGVINADTALHLPDFRAAERTFQLVAQVAGRTGRGERGGRVLVQTLSPEHPAIAAAVRHDYEAFAEGELATRRRAQYPPFSDMVRLVVRGPQEATARASAAHLGDELRRLSEGREGVRVLGPGAAPIARLRGEYRFQLQVQAPPKSLCENRRGLAQFAESSEQIVPDPLPESGSRIGSESDLQALIRAAVKDYAPPDDVRWTVDVDPWDMQ